MADQDDLAGVTLDMSKSQPLPTAAPAKDLSGVKLDMSQSKPISGSAISPAAKTPQKPQEPGMIDIANKSYEGPGVMNALGRLGMAIPNMARGIYHAAADAPKDETEQAEIG